MNYAFSADWTSVEFSAPYRAFMNYSNGQPAFSLGKQVCIHRCRAQALATARVRHRGLTRSRTLVR